MLRLLHTSDWHLGHQLHGQDRAEEHRRFLAWLLGVLVDERVDALIVAGDVFDSANPSAESTRLWYDFLARAARSRPGLSVLVIGGNHDSASRLEAPEALCAGLGVHVVGALRWGEDAPRIAPLLVPLRPADAPGDEPLAWAALVPFLRPVDRLRAVQRAVADLAARDEAAAKALASDAAAHDALAHRAVYAAALSAAREQAGPLPLVTTGHAFVAGRQPLEDDSVRGGLEALSSDVFGTEAAYVALGHIHRAHEVAPSGTVSDGDAAPIIRYSGSPLPCSLAAAGDRHHVLLVELGGARVSSVRHVEVPQARRLLRVPARGAATAEAARAAVAAVPAPAPGELPGLVEVAVELEAPEPLLRIELERALDAVGHRLAGLSISWPGRVAASDESLVSLAELTPAQVLAELYRRDGAGEPPADILREFELLLAEVQGADAEAAPIRAEGEAL